MRSDVGVVLIVAADERLRGVITRLFTRAGYPTSELDSGEEALAWARKDPPPSLVLLDLELSDMSGYEACAELRDQFGDQMPILLLSEDRTKPRDRVAGLLIGADDYVTRPFDGDELLARARRLVARGPGPTSTPETPLTGRELQVLELLAGGLSQGGIAKELFISPKTVGTYIQRILTKFDVHSRTEAVALAYREGIVQGPTRPTDAVGGRDE